MSTEWDRKFARMVAETERHLASVKNQLGSPGRAKRNLPGHKRSPLRSSAHNKGSTSPFLSKTTSILRNSSSTNRGSLSFLMPPSPPKNVTFQSPSHHMASPSSTTTTTAAAAVSLLSEKIKNQQKEMFSLRESLNGMQFQLKQQHNEIASLRDQMHVLQLRHSNEGAGKGWSQREDKQLQQFRQEVKLELDALKKRVQNSSVSHLGQHHSSCKDVSSSFPSDEVLGSKLRRNDVILSLQRELSTIKSKLASQGLRVGGVASELKEVKQEQEATSKFAKSWKKMPDSHDVISKQSLQLQHLGDLLSSLERRLEYVEESSFMPSNTTSNTHSNTSNTSNTCNTRSNKRHAPLDSTHLFPSPSHNDRRRTHLGTTPLHSDPSSTTSGGTKMRRGSALKASKSVGVARTTKFHPLCGEAVKLSSSLPSLRSNATSSTSFQRGKGVARSHRGFVLDGCSLLEGVGSEEGDEDSKGTLENSDLDGHTLSCSLELMSDFGGSEELLNSVDLNSDLDTDDTLSLSNLLK